MKDDEDDDGIDGNTKKQGILNDRTHLNPCWHWTVIDVEKKSIAKRKTVENARLVGNIENAL